MDMCYLPLSCIKSRVAYCSTTINFGRIAGQDSVYIVVPVNYHYVCASAVGAFQRKRSILNRSVLRGNSARSERRLV